MPDDRDYLAEVREAVEDYLDAHESGLVPGIAAAELGEKWEEIDPKLLRGWLMLRWQGILAEYISTLSRSRTARASRTRTKARFAEFAADFEAGDTDEREKSYAHWHSFYEVTVGDSKVRKALHYLTSGELRQVRDGYRRRRDENAFYEAVLDQMVKKVARAGVDKTVGDVYSKEQLEAMFERHE